MQERLVWYASNRFLCTAGAVFKPFASECHAKITAAESVPSNPMGLGFSRLRVTSHASQQRADGSWQDRVALELLGRVRTAQVGRAQVGRAQVGRALNVPEPPMQNTHKNLQGKK